VTVWIKICGLTTPEAVTAALDAGADAIGFVFAKSVRQVSADVALRLAAPARGRALCVAVTRHPSQQDIDEIVSVFKPDVLQTDSADLALLRLPTQLELLPVMRGAGGEAEAAGGVGRRELTPMRGAGDGKSAAGRGERGDQGRGWDGGDDGDELVVLLPPRLLFEGLTSGAGVPCDWTAAGRVARRTELVLAGGLNPANVAAAIAAVQPFGVDVSTGVEVRPGVKSPAEIMNFVRAARESGAVCEVRV
jgi:phosphoribosylanthranilate isomerase